MAEAKGRHKKDNKQAGAELCQAQGSAKLTASYSLAIGQLENLRIRGLLCWVFFCQIDFCQKDFC